MGMNWDFASRSGTLNITGFDTSVTPSGLSFGGTMTMPGVVDGQIVPTGLPNQFSGALTGNNPVVGALGGSANGSFVSSPGLGQAPNGVIGNWNVSNAGIDTPATYGATGIFGARR
jgi:hypothetical protein